MDNGGLWCFTGSWQAVDRRDRPCLLTRGAIRDSNAICQERPGRLLFRRCPSDGKGRYDAGDAGARYEVRDSSEQHCTPYHDGTSYVASFLLSVINRKAQSTQQAWAWMWMRA
jgi:hypothetical protein